MVCTYNRSSSLRLCLKKLIGQDTESQFTFENLVVDNASTDDTHSVVMQIAKSSCNVPVKYVMEKKPGLANARNTAIKEAKGDWIVCFDDDEFAEPEWLRELYKIATTRRADCVGGRTLLDLHLVPNVSISKGCRGLLGESDYGEFARRLRGKEYPHDGNVIRHRRVFDAVGEFDTAMVNGGQDQDYTRRAMAKNFRMWYAPKAVAYHSVPPYRLKPIYFKWSSYRAGYNFAYMDHKYGGPKRLLVLCIMRIGQALLMNIPKYLINLLKSNKSESLWRKALLYRCLAYCRMCIYLLFPRLFGKGSILHGLEFRKEREKFVHEELSL